MRIAHVCEVPSDRISGMVNSVKELCEAEIELGVEASIIDPRFPTGGNRIKLRRRVIISQSFDWATQPDTVAIISCDPRGYLHRFKHKIFISHGTPFYAFYEQLVSGKRSLDASIGMIRECDATICWWNYEAEYWRVMYPEKPIYAVGHGIDLEYWKPKPETKTKFNLHPAIVYADVHRINKLPFTFLFAVKKAQSKLPNIRVNILGMESSQAPIWMMLIAKLNLEMVVENVILGLAEDPRDVFQAADMIVSPTFDGLMSRVAIEGLALGTPTIILKGQDECVAYAKCDNSPQSMAEAIVKVWSDIQEDPEVVRRKCRRIAMEHYDVKETARRVIDIAESLL